MSVEHEPEELARRIAAGDAKALELLLLRYHRRLAARIERKLPADLRGVLAAEDVLQDAFVAAFRDIDQFRRQGRNAVFRWLATIAENRLFDAVRARRTAKRGGGRRALGADPDSDMIELIQTMAVYERTPSRSAARLEAAASVGAALAGLKEDYREALRLHYGDGLSIAAVAAQMNKTEPSVHKLCRRGLERMREVLGTSSQFLSRK